ncbi:MAG: hypothetical protein JNL29_16490 [Nitrospira sp.]|nr:hypothetical protein [Nitrospira sp.]
MKRFALTATVQIETPEELQLIEDRATDVGLGPRTPDLCAMLGLAGTVRWISPRG